MTHRFVRASLIAILASLLVTPSLRVFACGPDFTGPILVDATGPSFPITDYVRGRLELLLPTYWHEPLFIAYRNLSGKPFTASELSNFNESSTEQAASAAKDWVEAWKATRTNILIGAAVDNSLRLYNSGHGVTRQLDHPDSFVEYYNCLDGAFEHAVQILNKRVEEFGPRSPAVKDWIAAQDQVFENCAGGPGYPPKPKSAVIPVAAHPDDPELIRADRAYQIAAAHFYAGEYDLAQAGFEAIAKDPTSPYNKLAPYLVARVLTRRGTLEIDDEQGGLKALAEAEVKLRAVLADKRLEEIHDAAERQLAFITIRLHRGQRFYELEKSLSAGGAAKTFHQDLLDYLWLLDRGTFTNGTEPESGSTQPPAPPDAALEKGAHLKSGDMTDWIFTFQQTSDAAYQHSLQRWQETKSLPWLVAAIAKASANDKAAPDLSAAAAKIAPDSPAYVTVTFHRLRILAQSRNADEARRQLDQILAQHALLRSANNQFLALRMKLAANLEDFLRFAPRTSDDAVLFPNPSEGAAKPSQENAVHFDADGSVILTEKLPLRLLADAAKSTTLPPALRREVVVAAWTRSILLDRDFTSHELSAVAMDLVPEAADEFANYLHILDVPSARFAATLAILRNPGFRPFVTAGYPRGNLYTIGEPRFDRIDSLRDNWWCSPAAATETQYYGADYYRMFAAPSAALAEIYPGNRVTSPAFLTAEDRATADKERAELEAQPAAPNWLGKRTLDWADAHPDDPRVPEALHLVVRAWRYGCSDSSHENYSKSAFTLLHKRYPDNEWTKKTPYWFE